MTGVEQRSRAGVIGLGAMGSALAEALVAAGHEVTVWNRTAAKADALRAKGVTVAASPEHVLTTSEVTVVCVSDHAATMEILGALALAPQEDKRLLVQLSTMSPEASEELAGWATNQGLSYLEGTILGFPADIAAGSATIIYAGPREVFDAQEAVLRCLGPAQHLSESIGAAVSFDKVYYAFVYGTILAFLQSAAMAHAKGFALDGFLETVIARVPIFAERFRLLSDFLIPRNHDNPQCAIDVHAAAFGETLKLCRELGVDDGMPRAIMRNFQLAQEAGCGDQEITAIFECLIDHKHS